MVSQPLFTRCSGLATDDPLVVVLLLLLLPQPLPLPPTISVGPAEAAFVTVVDCQPVLTELRVCESYVRTRTRTVWLPTLKLGGAYRYVPSAPTTNVMSGVFPVPSIEISTCAPAASGPVTVPAIVGAIRCP